MKKCTRCEKKKGFDEFYISRRKDKSGKVKEYVRSRCKQCLANITKERRDEVYKQAGNKEALKRLEMLRSRGECPEGHRWCSSCKCYLSFDKFRKSALKNKKGIQCARCSSHYARNKYRLKKLKAIKYLGGECRRCGWVGHWAAYDFHHVDPNLKDKDWGHGLNKLSWKKVEAELKKCVLLCRNCHTIVHSILDENGNFNPEYVPKRGDPHIPER